MENRKKWTSNNRNVHGDGATGGDTDQVSGLEHGSGPDQGRGDLGNSEMGSCDRGNSDLRSEVGAVVTGKPEELSPNLGQFFGGPEEALLPDLRPFVKEGAMGQGIFHPLLFFSFYHPGMNAYVNKCFLHKKDLLCRAKEDGDFSQFLFLHERPYRLHAFLEIRELLDDGSYWEQLGDIFSDSEGVGINRKVWVALLSSDRPKKERFMTPSEQAAFALLPEELTVYRGYVKGKNRKGLSFTLSPKIAGWYAARFSQKNGAVYSRTIRKEQAFAYLTRRSEEEIVILG